VRGRPRIAGHKGACAYTAGNTLESFDLAIKLGADCIELDVQLTADDQILVYDRNYVTINGNSIPTAYATRTQMLAARSDNSKSAGAGQKQTSLVELREALEFLKGRNVEVLIELKNGLLLQPADLGIRVSNLVDAAGMTSGTYVMSFDHELILAMRKRTRLRTGLLFVGRLIALDATLDATGATFIETRNDFIDIQAVDELHRRGFEVFGWSTVDPQEIERLCEIGVDMITTDAPDVAQQLVSSMDFDSIRRH
jgi:glycerophosphoryl diester phosphodiesterase